MHSNSYEPVSHDGSATGGPEQPISKPMDKPPKQYMANETVPQDNFHEEPCDYAKDNVVSLAKKFVGDGGAY